MAAALLLGLAFLAVVGLWTGPAALAAGVSAQFEAETMTHGDAFAVVYEDTEASGGAGLRHTTDNGTATRRVDLAAGGTKVLITARAGQMYGTPSVQVEVDGRSYGPVVPITGKKIWPYRVYEVAGGDIPAGSHTIGLRSIGVAKGHNLFVDRVEVIGGSVVDTDGDGVADGQDNCAKVSNRDQADLDRDGIGNVCDSDRDGDGVANGQDPAPDDPNVAVPPSTCQGTEIRPGQDLDAVVNSDPGSKATTFCVLAATSGTSYQVDNTIRLGSGDKLIGPSGSTISRGPARYGVPRVRIVGLKTMEKVIELRGTNHLRWLDVSGGVMGIAASQATPQTTMEYLVVHGASRTGITSMNGHLLRSELYGNGTDSRWWGHSASAVKGQTEYEAAYNYVHDNPANGLWCDVGCAGAGKTAMPNGFWAHDNLVVRNGRWGVRYESSPLLPSGEKSAETSALVERNNIHANGWQEGRYGGAAMWDAQTGTFRANVFGPATVSGQNFEANAGRRAIVFFDSGKATRTDLYNGEAVGNILRGDTIYGCEQPDNIVRCADNG